jgi:hypothetical protein
MRYQELTHRPPERHADTDVATLFVPHEAASKLLSLCARYNAQILSVQPLAKVYGGFSVEVLSPDHSGSELLAGWVDVVRVLEEGQAS